MLKWANNSYFVATSLLMLLLFGSFSTATSSIAYHGRIIKPNGSAFEPNSATLVLQIRSTGTEDCLMWEETFSNVNMSGSGGVFSLNLHSGTGTRTDGSGLTFDQVFGNYPTSTMTVPLVNCDGGSNTITLTSSSHRIARLKFKDAIMPSFEQTPDMAIAYVPFSMDSQKVGGFTPQNLLRVEDATGPQAAAAFSPADFLELQALIAGSSGQYEKAGELNGQAIPALSNNNVLAWNGGGWTAVTPITSETDPNARAFAKADLPTCNSGEFLTSTGANTWVCAGVTGASGGTVTSITVGSGLVDGSNNTGTSILTTGTIALPDVVTAGTGTKVTFDAKGRITASTTLAETDLPNITTAGKVSGDAITSGTIAGSTAMNTSGNITAATGSLRTLVLRDADTNTVTVQTPADVTANYVLTLPPNDGGAGEVLTTDGSGVMTWTSVSSVLPANAVLDGGNTVSATMNVGTNSTHNLQFETDGTARMAIDTAGKVAIGTTTPTELLHIKVPSGWGGIHIENPSFSSDLNIISRGGPGGENLIESPVESLIISAGGDPTIHFLAFGTNNKTERMRIAADGNVGIGTTTPGTMLDVAGAITSRPFGTSTGETGQFILRELAANGTDAVTVRARDSFSSYVLTLPIDDGGAGEVLSSDGNGNLSWVSVAGAGAVTSMGAVGATPNANAGTITSGVLNLQPANTTHPGVVVLAADGGTTASTVVQATDSRLTNSRAPSGTASGDLDGTYPGPTVVKIQGEDVDATTPLDTQVMKYVTNKWVPTYINFADLKKADGTPQVVGASCTAGQTMIWSSITDLFTCTDISITAAKISDLDTAVAKIDGNTVTATMDIGTNSAHNLQLETGGSPRVTIDTSGNVGIGTATPNQKLEVNGAALLSDWLIGSQYMMGNSVGDRTISGGWTGAGAKLNLLSSSQNWGSPPAESGSQSRVTLGNGAMEYVSAFSADQTFYTKDAPGGVYNNVALMTLKASGNVGIGTAAPGTLLDVAGAITSRPFGTSTGNTGQFILRELAANGTDAVTIRSPDALAAPYNLTLPTDDGNSGEVLTTDGSGVLSWTAAPAAASVAAGAGSAAAPSMSFSGDPNTGFYSSAADKIGVAANGAQIFDFSSGGLTSPTAGGATVTTANGTAAAPTFSFTGDEDTGWFRPAADTLAASTAGTERVRIDSSGNVGIGTSSPSYKFEVSTGGTNNVALFGRGTTSALGYLAIQQSSIGTSSLVRVADAGAQLDVDPMPLDGTSTANVRFFRSTNTSGSRDVDFLRGDGTTTVDHRIESGTNGTSFFAANGGKVGIGTTNPAGQLEVATTNSYVLASTRAGGAPNIVVRRTNGTFAAKTTVVNGDSLGSLLATPYDGSSYVETASIGFKTNGTVATGSVPTDITFNPGTTAPAEAMRITSGGSVGVGTTVPGTLLDVAGAITSRPFGTSTGNTGQFILRELAASGTDTVTIRSPDALAAPYILTLPIDDGNSGEVLTTNGSGVLSWTAAPAAASVAAGAGSAAAPSMSFSGDPNTGFYSSAADKIGVAANGAQIFDFGSGGLTSPTAGGATVTTANGTAAAPTFSFTGDEDTGWFRPAADTLAAATAGTEKVRITSTGNVGIGTTSPTARLEVAGNVSAADWGTAGIGLKIPTATYQNTTSSGTINSSVHIIASPTLSATNPTTVNVSTLSISAPTMSTNVTGGTVAALGLAGNFVQSVGSSSFSAGTTPSLVGLVNLTGNRSAASWTTNGGMLSVQGNTLTNTSGSGTIATQVSNSFGTPTMASTSAMTVTNAANVYIAGAPAAGTNTTFTNSQALYVASGASYFGGNVGIGITSPSNPLDVYGSLGRFQSFPTNGRVVFSSNDNAVTPILNLRNTQETAGYGVGIQFDLGYGGTSGVAGTAITSAKISAIAENTYTSTASTQDASLQFQTAADGTVIEKMRITSGGNVGVGTTVPGTLLDVAGAITSRPFGTSTGNTGQFILRELVANGTNTATIRAPDALAADYVLTLPIDDGNSGEVLTTNGSGVLSWTAAPAAASVAAGAGSAAAPSMSFSGDPNTGFYSSAADKIGVAANGAQIFDFGSGGLTSPTAGGATVTTANGTAAAPTFSFTGDEDTGWFRPAADTLAASTAGTEKVRITSAGNVGIGTTIPTSDAPLHVYKSSSGTIRSLVQNPATGASVQARYDLATGTANSYAITSLNDNNGAPYILSSVGSAVTGTYNDSPIHAFRSQGAVEAMRVQSGMVSIGGFVPSYQLDVQKTATDTSGTVVQSSQVLTLTPGSNSTATSYGDISYTYTGANAFNHNILQAKRTGVIHSGTGTVAQAYGTSSGVTNNTTGTVTLAVGNTGEITNVSTGTITTAYGLQSTVTRSAGTITNGYGVYVGAIQATNKWSVYAGDTTAPSYFGGNVGIGTTLPGSALDVKGTLRLSGATSGHVGFAPAATAGSTTYTLPSADATVSGQSLTSDASGNLSWKSMNSVSIMGINSTISASTTAYIAYGAPLSNATEAQVQTPLPASGTVRATYVRTTTAQPASGSLVLTLRKNGADCNIVITIAASSAAGSYSDTAHTCTYVAGDLLNWKVVNSATGTSTNVMFINSNSTP